MKKLILLASLLFIATQTLPSDDTSLSALALANKEKELTSAPTAAPVKDRLLTATQTAVPYLTPGAVGAVPWLAIHMARTLTTPKGSSIIPTLVLGVAGGAVVYEDIKIKSQEKVGADKRKQIIIEETKELAAQIGIFYALSKLLDLNFSLGTATTCVLTGRSITSLVKRAQELHKASSSEHSKP